MDLPDNLSDLENKDSSTEFYIKTLGNEIVKGLINALGLGF